MRETGNPTRDLPDAPAALRALLLAAWAERDSVTSERDSLSAERDSITSERDSLSAERDALMERIERLQHLLQKLQRMQFGPRSERLPADQLLSCPRLFWTPLCPRSPPW
jgi:septal ring factor EnvC (AmiA/AmiB activator)